MERADRARVQGVNRHLPAACGHGVKEKDRQDGMCPLGWVIQLRLQVWTGFQTSSSSSGGHLPAEESQLPLT